MNSNSNSHGSTAIIYRSLEELHTLLSALEEQTKLGLFPAQPEIGAVKIAIPEDSSSGSEENGSLPDWL